MNLLDVLLVVFLVLAGVSGYRRGLALQAFAFGGLLLGLVAGALLAPRVAGLADGQVVQATIVAAILASLGVAGSTAGRLVGTRVRERAHATRLRGLDAAGGSAVAVGASILLIWFLALNLATGPLPSVSGQIRGSAIVRGIDAALPAPPSPLAQARLFFNSLGFPDVFTGIPPVPADPVQPPSQEQARAAVDAGASSTFRVAGLACESILEGSAFVIAERYLVTNAHVVAGVEEPQVQAPGGGRVPATTVLFDPDLDLAVLFLDQTQGTPLVLATGSLGRGTSGAVLGYPAGGPLDAHRAAVLRTFEAVGRDIYGRGEIERTVLELQTRVRPGNSGGPFVLSDGRVGGVVFAASSGDEDVGYAIASSELEEAVAVALGTTTEVDTGPCLP